MTMTIVATVIERQAQRRAVEGGLRHRKEAPVPQKTSRCESDIEESVGGWVGGPLGVLIIGGRI